MIRKTPEPNAGELYSSSRQTRRLHSSKSLTTLMPRCLLHTNNKVQICARKIRSTKKNVLFPGLTFPRQKKIQGEVNQQAVRSSFGYHRRTPLNFLGGQRASICFLWAVRWPPRAPEGGRRPYGGGALRGAPPLREVQKYIRAYNPSPTTN